MQVEAIQKSYRRWAPVYDLTFGRITQGGQVVGLVPLEQQVTEGEQLVLRFGRQRDVEGGQAAGKGVLAHAAGDGVWRLR